MLQKALDRNRNYWKLQVWRHIFCYFKTL